MGGHTSGPSTLGFGGNSGFLGAGGQSGLLGTGLFSSGPQQVSGFEYRPGQKQYEQALLARQNDIASGKTPGYGELAMNRNIDQANQQGLALAASARGSSPALAFRQAQLGNQQNQLEGAQQGALLSAQQRMQADQLLAASLAANKGIAFQQANTNLGATLQNQQTQTNGLAAIGGAAASAAGAKKWYGGKVGCADGGMVPGEASVKGDSPSNDTVNLDVSPGEVIIPRSIAKDPEAVKSFVAAISKGKSSEKSADIGKLMAEISKLTDKVNKLA